ncbi:MAG TPA: hypothetical protein VG963_03345 [Polyangiaceae bacterium]|nr:hypothetical protein [Polyangiaceae bacterium]
MAKAAVSRAQNGARRARFPHLAPLHGSLQKRIVMGSTCLGLGCGGASPLLHPAQTLPVDSVSVGAGVSGNFASSSVDRAISQGRAATGGPLSDPATARTYAEGLLVNALVAPGASPWVSARVGLPESSEAGLTYTGRALRVDGRHAFDLAPDLLLSVGVGASGLLLAPDRGPPRPEEAGSAASSPAEFELQGKGFGADVPVLLGYQVVEGFFEVWLGPRLGVEFLSGDLRLRPPDPDSPVLHASGHRVWAGAVAGFSLGIPPLWLRFELAPTYHDVSGALSSSGAAPGVNFDRIEATGWTLSPSGAIVGKF